MKYVLFGSILMLGSFFAEASTVDTIDVYSNCMQKNIKTVIVLPDDYKTAKELPVFYLLHGYSGNYSNYIKKVEYIKEAVDKYNLIIVCPDGGFGSWYFDSPIDKTVRYETFVTDELVKHIDSHYKTKKHKKGRAISGLSMGGHGALYLAFRHQDVYGAAGSMSGGVDIRPFPKNWDLEKDLGSYADNPENWEKNTVINMIDLLKPNGLSLIIDCGSEDFFYNVNENLHQLLITKKIPHDYISRPGVHNWDYWNNSIKYQLLFMNNYFQNK